MKELSAPRKLWEHPHPETTQLWKFKTSLEKKLGHTFEVGITFSLTLKFETLAKHHERSIRPPSTSKLI